MLFYWPFFQNVKIIKKKNPIYFDLKYRLYFVVTSSNRIFAKNS